jgi:pilus assembly protein CpaB
MSQRRRIASFAIALIAAVGGSFGIYSALDAPNAQKRVSTRPVVVSLQDISAGHAIERTSVAVARWPLGTIPAGAYAAVDSVVGRVARVGIFKGEVLMPNRLVPDNAVGIRR